MHDVRWLLLFWRPVENSDEWRLLLWAHGGQNKLQWWLLEQLCQLLHFRWLASTVGRVRECHPSPMEKVGPTDVFEFYIETENDMWFPCSCQWRKSECDLQVPDDSPLQWDGCGIKLHEYECFAMEWANVRAEWLPVLLLHLGLFNTR